MGVANIRSNFIYQERNMMPTVIRFKINAGFLVLTWVNCTDRSLNRNKEMMKIRWNLNIHKVQLFCHWFRLDVQFIFTLLTTSMLLQPAYTASCNVLTSLYWLSMPEICCFPSKCFSFVNQNILNCCYHILENNRIHSNRW